MRKNKIRDDLIRTQYEKGLGGKIGRAQSPPISRQRVGQIVSQKQARFWATLKKVWLWLRAIK